MTKLAIIRALPALACVVGAIVAACFGVKEWPLFLLFAWLIA